MVAQGFVMINLCVFLFKELMIDECDSFSDCVAMVMKIEYTKKEKI